MRYPVTLEKDNGVYIVSFPDIPEALTQGHTRDEALEMARDALVTAFEFYFEDDEAIPAPGDVTGDYVEVPASVAAKVLMLNTFKASRLTRVELAARMGIKKQEVSRIFDLRHTTKIDTIQSALSAMGRKLVLAAH
ncbi:type II toxin-antitoxin system HicB family antitoxin [Nissabacter sp. SGAir0207]|uniref:type II toxin-antitoxin system HicB family antitoxin n=1 Tax=Nissabacter sp. SGAir0207 TaxID=2126321 RepID=UPI0010CD0010|nr:type II toxin-antitoxin system HicB family antitoxin [Nissabacter sp. SGAir0207]QCR38958.1 antitoxin [Nissabacter sp. SGAir0207]